MVDRLTDRQTHTHKASTVTIDPTTCDGVKIDKLMNYRQLAHTTQWCYNITTTQKPHILTSENFLRAMCRTSENISITYKTEI